MLSISVLPFSSVVGCAGPAFPSQRLGIFLQTPPPGGGIMVALHIKQIKGERMVFDGCLARLREAGAGLP